MTRLWRWWWSDAGWWLKVAVLLLALTLLGRHAVYWADEHDPQLEDLILAERKYPARGPDGAEQSYDGVIKWLPALRVVGAEPGRLYTVTDHGYDLRLVGPFTLLPEAREASGTQHPGMNAGATAARVTHPGLKAGASPLSTQHSALSTYLPPGVESGAALRIALDDPALWDDPAEARELRLGDELQVEARFDAGRFEFEVRRLRLSTGWRRYRIAQFAVSGLVLLVLAARLGLSWRGRAPTEPRHA